LGNFDVWYYSRVIFRGDQVLMSKKKSLFSTVLFSLVSLVSGKGFRQGVNQTFNPESMDNVMVLWQTMGWHLAVILMTPLLIYFVHGYFLSEWRRENYWLLGIVIFLVSLGVVVLYPLVLLHL
jgi:hypothetical protein